MKVGQSRAMSLVESVTNNVVGFLVSVSIYALVLPLFGLRITMTTNVSMVLIFTAVGMLRSYIIRRVFNWLSGG